MSIRSFKRAHARRAARERRRLDLAKRRGAAVAGATLTAAALLASTAEAATLHVTNTNDSGVGSLRDAITTANTNVDTSNTIVFDSGVTGTVHVATPLTITAQKPLTITGPGASSLTLDGGGATQILNISANSSSRSSPTPISISGLTFSNGAGNSSTPGGAIENRPASGYAAALTLTDVTVSGSTTADTTGGGGIYTRGPLTLNGSTVTGNTAPSGPGGGIRGDNASSFKYPLVINDSTITGNTAKAGGGLSTGYSGPEGMHVTVSDSRFTNNQATGSGTPGGAIFVTGGSLNMTGSTVSGNTTGGVGGGILTATKYGTSIASSTISGNTAAHGGGLEIVGYSSYPNQFAKYNPVHVLNTTITGNQAPNGAGIEIPVDLGGTAVTIESSTISGNQGGAHSIGGGILVPKYLASPIKVLDSTISGNTASTGAGVSLGYGGATKPFLFPKSTKGSVTFENSTIASNAASSSGGGGGIYLGQYNTGSPSVNQSPSATLLSTIVSGNTAAGAQQDLARPATSTTGGFHEAFSLIQTPGSAPVLSTESTITGVSPQLGPLANNGGPTQTMLPAGTSPVIDQGHAAKSVTADQRGGSRTVDVPTVSNPPGGDGTDIGAVELPASSVVAPAGLSATVRSSLIGGPGAPLLVGSSTPVRCAVRLGTLDTCVIEVRNSRGALLASGEATSSSSPTSLSPIVFLTTAGMNALKHNPLGLNALATVFASTSKSGRQTISGNVHLLAGPSITLALSKRSPKLSSGVLHELSTVAHILSGASSITCTAYSDRGKRDATLTKDQAKAACARLVKDGFKGKTKSVGKGHSHPVAPNTSSKNRAKNRRLVITFRF